MRPANRYNRIYRLISKMRWQGWSQRKTIRGVHVTISVCKYHSLSCRGFLLSFCFSTKVRTQIVTMRFSTRSSYLLSLFPPSNRYLATSRRYASTKTSDPLRILFCGSEEFSIASLRALHKEHEKNPNLIASIDVVCRKAKRVGRNLKEFREGNILSSNPMKLC